MLKYLVEVGGLSFSTKMNQDKLPKPTVCYYNKTNLKLQTIEAYGLMPFNHKFAMLRKKRAVKSRFIFNFIVQRIKLSILQLSLSIKIKQWLAFIYIFPFANRLATIATFTFRPHFG
jgi:hypothetical protein